MQHYAFQVTAPANTPQSSPVEVATALDPGVVKAIHLRIPSGHASLTGIRIAYAHQAVIPKNTGGWVLGNSTEHDFQPEGSEHSGAWSVWLYNTDNRAHYWQVTYDVQGLPAHHEAAQLLPMPLTAASIYSEMLGIPEAEGAGV